MLMMRVSDILKSCEGSCDFGDVDYYDGETFEDKQFNFWTEVIANKSSDTGFGHLVESILKDGFVEGSAIGWNRGRITEGHHRLVAAILLGMDEVPVSKWGMDTAHCISAHRCDEEPYPIEVMV